MEFKPASSCYYCSLLKFSLSKIMKTVCTASLVLLTLSMLGCVTSSLSESSDSFSASVKSSSKSFTSSSDESKESYLRDIKQYTAVYTRSSSDIMGLTRGLSAVSAKHGVTDWEAYTATYLGIGEGFAKADLTQENANIYSAYLANGDQVKIAAIQQGFRQGQ